MGQAVDVRNQAASKSRQSVFEISNALDLSPDAVVAPEPQDHITYLNRAAELARGMKDRDQVYR